MRVAEHSRAVSEMTGVVFLNLGETTQGRDVGEYDGSNNVETAQGTNHLLKSLFCKDVSLMNQSVQQLSARLYDRHVWDLEAILLRLDIQDHLEGLFVEGHERVEACEVEVILNEFFRDLCEVFVPR